MAYSNILSRRFPNEFINLGFSGNGKGEPELARLIGQIERPACLILDYEANNPSPAHMERTLPAFIRIYREKHPIVPIVVLSQPRMSSDTFHADHREARSARLAVQARAVEELRQAGDANVYFYDGGELFGRDFPECTVDGSHPTDLGFQRMADRLTPILADILG